MSTTVAPAIGTTTWNLDATHTSIEFSVKHLMISTVKGRFGSFTGTVVVDEAHPERAKIEVAIDVASIDTRTEQRDAHLRSADFFDAEQFPKITFVGTRLEGDPNGEFTLVGDLTIKGTTREIALHGENEGRGKDPWGGERVGFSLKGKFSRGDFGITWNAALETGGVVVSDEVKLSIDAEFVKAA